MPRRLSAEQWRELEVLARRFCETRMEYRRRKEAGTLGMELEQRMIQMLNEMDLQIERIKSGNEIERHRNGRPRERKASGAVWRTA
ncbi:MAG: hypothetical protein KIS92_17425 [Planctomycetota bacterium]|nr:hypothetical protein [Planctomycetota bacterium]